MVCVAPEALTLLASQAFHDINFFLRPAHLKQVAAILDDPEASENDRMVALTMLRNADVASAGVLPFCQDTGTAIIMGQNAPLTMWEEKNTGTNLPAQLDLFAVDGDEYRFLFIAKGGGSANKSYLYQETRAILNPKSLVEYLTSRMVSLGTAACPPYHLVFVIGGTSAESTMKIVKLASTKYLDHLPTTGNAQGRAFRDVELEAQMLAQAQSCGIGAQFGGPGHSAAAARSITANRDRRVMQRGPAGQRRDQPRRSVSGTTGFRTSQIHPGDVATSQG
jgi:fumarate hydratase class I